MKYGLLIVGALLLFGWGLATTPPAMAGFQVQASGSVTPQAQQTAGTALGQAPANVTGQEPNEAVGLFLPVCLGTGIVFACIGAIVASRRDAAKADRTRAHKVAGGH